MFVYLKESELHKKLFINKNYKQATVKLVFDKNTPVHEVSDETLAAAIVASFPNYLESSKDKPSFSVKKAEPRSADPIPAPVEIKEEVAEEPVTEAPIEEAKEEAPVEEVKEVKKPGRRRKSLK